MNALSIYHCNFLYGFCTCCYTLNAHLSVITQSGPEKIA